jgi:hypothetical protein
MLPGEILLTGIVLYIRPKSTGMCHFHFMSVTHAKFPVGDMSCNFCGRDLCHLYMQVIAHA